jgi:hypothetical protein
MISKNYQRRHLRAPFKDPILYADGVYVHVAIGLNISEGGLLIDELPSFPECDEVPLMFCVPELPLFQNHSLLKMQSFHKDQLMLHVVRVKARMVRREQLSQSLDNLFRARFGLEFIRITSYDQKHIENFIVTFCANLVHLQALIDSFNKDEETKHKVRVLAKILGYEPTEKIAQLRTLVVEDYKSLQWL